MAAFTIITGLLVGVLIGAVTEIYTSGDYRFVKKIAKQSETGSATTIISGLAVGMQSTAVPILLVCVGVLISNKLMGLYGIALAAVGMLSTTGITVAIDAYGPMFLQDKCCFAHNSSRVTFVTLIFLLFIKVVLQEDRSYQPTHLLFSK